MHIKIEALSIRSKSNYNNCAILNIIPIFIYIYIRYYNILYKIFLVRIYYI